MRAEKISLYQPIAAIVSILTGYVAATSCTCALQFFLFNHARASMAFRQYLATGYGHFLLLLYLAFGLPHLLIRPVAVLHRNLNRAAVGGTAVGLSIASGIALLFVLLDHGRGAVLFVLSSLLFGAVTGIVTVTLFRLLAPQKSFTPLLPARDASVFRRIAVSLASLAAGCAAPCLLLFIGSALFDRFDSPARWLPLANFLLVFSLTGWFLFGLPIFVLGPLRHHFVRPLPSALAGGVAAAVLVESYNRTMFATLFTLRSLTIDAVFNAIAFLIGALTIYLYVRYRGNKRSSLF